MLQAEDDLVAHLLCPDVIIEEMGDEIDDTVAENTNLDDLLTDYNVTGIKARFYLTNEEEKLRAEIYTPNNPVQYTKIHCTSCKRKERHLGSALDSIDNVFVHSVLNVLVCKNCFLFYNSGDFEKDKDGAEMYCRWCGQGGQVFCCNTCTFVFCRYCVRSNLSVQEYSVIRDGDYWECFVCDPKQIVKLKVLCYEFVSYVTKELDRIKNMPESEFYMSIDHSTCSCNLSPRRSTRLSMGIKSEVKSEIDDPDFSPDMTECNKQTKIRKKINTDYKEVAKMTINFPEVTITPLPNISRLPIQPTDFTSLPLQVQINPIASLPSYPAASQSSSQPAHKAPMQPLQVETPSSQPSFHPQLVPMQPPQVTTPSSQPSFHPQFVPNQPLKVTTPLSQPSFHPQRVPMQPLQVTTPSSQPSFYPQLVPTRSLQPYTQPIAPQTLSQPIVQNQFRFPVPNMPQIVLNRASQLSKHVNKCMMTTALANSSFASTLLSINNLHSCSVNKAGEQETVAIYESLDKSIELMVQSLVDVKSHLGYFKLANGDAPTTSRN